MQTQFWKKLKEEIYFIFLGRMVGIIIIIFTVITIILSSHFLSIGHPLFYLMPAIIVMVMNCLIFIALYQYNQTVQSGIQSRQTMIESTFETIHNGPLQSLAKVLRLVKGHDLPINKLLPTIEQELEELNQELRGMYELWQQETLTQDTSLYLGNNVVIDLRNPLSEILYQVYTYTLERDFPCFKTLKLKIHSFEPIYESSLSIENKRGLCRFLEEALCNVGKHAIGITCLQVTYSWVEDQGIYTLSIIDDGLGIYPLKEGWGTKQFKNLAQQIKGKFRRVSLYPQGTLCELSWPLPNSFWWQ
ncbi:sensor histidine kinase [Dolichospermum compactum]|uniref:Putative sensor with CHASE2 domain protein n=1 Tax=Dolichospermum compactum NIES-806 TaxID=1973481 RepID=A0A1Z4V2S2_9CYAN|nr:sensor histidine kinase [Dolichospermum compactum]BAZ85585.1 putative sensor with CHASE2 domain protein [Dolichospermum compactum NIES-806]